MSMGSPSTVIEVEGLVKTFRIGFTLRKVEALRGVSFTVNEGEIFGFLGPNGAGKTTTIKTIVGLLRPTQGTCTLLGKPAGTISARSDIGYLPESPYFYDNLLPEEFMDLCGRLRGLGRAQRRTRTDELLDKVGLGGARDRQLRKFSKGMLQRIGLAQSLIGDPKLLILDEPMTGLDPVGRKEVRDLIVELRSQGKTIFFSSHILSDVETICDRVVIVNKGRVTAHGALSELLSPAVRLVDLELEAAEADLPESITAAGVEVRAEGDVVHVTAKGEREADEVLRRALDAGIRVRAVTPRKETLENLFMRSALKDSDEAA
jgi:ABC-2 type transport system ATP-binding protein